MAVDDSREYLEAVQAVVEATPGFVWMKGFSSGAGILAEIAEEPDLLLVDINMPGMSGFELADRLGSSHPDVLVALVTALHPAELPETNPDSPPRPVLAKENLRSGWLRNFWLEHRGDPHGDR